MTGFSLSMDVGLKMIGKYLTSLLCRDEAKNENVFNEFLNYISKMFFFYLFHEQFNPICDCETAVYSLFLNYY